MTFKEHLKKEVFQCGYYQGAYIGTILTYIMIKIFNPNILYILFMPFGFIIWELLLYFILKQK